MKINIIAVGDLKERYWNSACDEYIKRISRYHKIDIIEISEEKLPKNYKDVDVAKALVKEGNRILEHARGYIIVMDVQGIQVDSIKFADLFTKTSLNYDTVSFIIGSSYGLSEDVKNRANMRLSVSPMTFPHQLFRVMLLEQIYRATAINNNVLYHK